jgi:fumarate hydratase class II
MKRMNKKEIKESQNWKELTKSLEKKIDKLNKDIKAGKVEFPSAVNVTCSQEDIERTSLIIRKIREKESKRSKHA